VPVLFRDIETRSTSNLADAGAWRYAADSCTEILCVGYAADDGPVKIWTTNQPIPEEFLIAARDPDWLVVAHHDAFESALEERLLQPRYGWPIVPTSRHRCTMALALAAALPASLEGAAAALDLPVQKDTDGRRLMRQMAKPRRPRKQEDPSLTYWHDDLERRLRLAEYCCRDVETERELYRRLPPLSDAEQAVWTLDAEINRRGFHVDRALTEAARRIVEAEQELINARVAELTGGAVTSVNQVARIKEFAGVASLTKTAVAAAVAAAEDDNAATALLGLRAEGGKASARKLDTLLASIDADDRVRGCFLYHGASTGRWSGRRVQPQNLAKAPKDSAAAIEAISSGDIDRVRRLGPPLAVVGSISRALVMAPPGHVLVGADFSAVESRVLAWLSGERWKLDVYRRFDETGDPTLEPTASPPRSCCAAR
jgi:DNA polymerase bacteriophage-type